MSLYVLTSVFFADGSCDLEKERLDVEDSVIDHDIGVHKSPTTTEDSWEKIDEWRLSGG